MGIQNFFVDEDGKFEICCPRCGIRKVALAKDFIGKHKFQVKCKCKSVFGIQLDFRKKHRKKTRLDGFVEIILNKEKWGKIISESITTNCQPLNCKISDISVLGIGLTILAKHEIKKGDGVTIEFTLDNSAFSRIEKNAIVRGVKDDYIGCEFFEADKLDPKLGFYVL